MTLEASFDAGKLVREAKKLKRKALMEQDQIEVGKNCKIIKVKTDKLRGIRYRNQFE